MQLSDSTRQYYKASELPLPLISACLCFISRSLLFLGLLHWYGVRPSSAPGSHSYGVCTLRKKAPLFKLQCLKSRGLAHSGHMTHPLISHHSQEGVNIMKGPGLGHIPASLAKVVKFIIGSLPTKTIGTFPQKTTSDFYAGKTIKITTK